MADMEMLMRRSKQNHHYVSRGNISLRIRSVNKKNSLIRARVTKKTPFKTPRAGLEGDGVWF